MPYFTGRSERIRTSDPCLPKAIRVQRFVDFTRFSPRFDPFETARNALKSLILVKTQEG
jgi:hypothetical protein